MKWRNLKWKKKILILSILGGTVFSLTMIQTFFDPFYIQFSKAERHNEDFMYNQEAGNRQSFEAMVALTKVENGNNNYWLTNILSQPVIDGKDGYLDSIDVWIFYLDIIDSLNYLSAFRGDADGSINTLFRETSTSYSKYDSLLNEAKK
jgi:hypothetical protein